MGKCNIPSIHENNHFANELGSRRRYEHMSRGRAERAARNFVPTFGHLSVTPLIRGPPAIDLDNGEPGPRLRGCEETQGQQTTFRVCLLFLGPVGYPQLRYSQLLLELFVGFVRPIPRNGCDCQQYVVPDVVPTEKAVNKILLYIGNLDFIL